MCSNNSKLRTIIDSAHEFYAFSTKIFHVFLFSYFTPEHFVFFLNNIHCRGKFQKSSVILHFNPNYMQTCRQLSRNYNCIMESPNEFCYAYIINK